MSSDVPPELRSIYNKIMNAAAQVDTAAIRLDRVSNGDWDPRTDVTDELMDALAAKEGASPELRQYAERVANGECRWDQIESRVKVLPIEVIELKQSPRVIWYPAPPKPVVDEYYDPYRIPWERPI
ncbi:hypothetical protein [Rhodococcus sp. OK302]|uniref:hypothetical protein n=1 Tax=Rhodococcus sp. OK302 TaxID=1882769 RepID=UPI000B942BA7|nr:hypothetical protein [Rhodococcus sp. OK302]OYD67880.1 hypothetical protein BDB13_1419 [Rhodococcus sp. OK302]